MSDPQGTFAWLVVVRDGTGTVSDSEDWPAGSPLYQCAGGWTHDVLKALRYARSEDALAVAINRNNGWPWGARAIIEEHGFAPLTTPVIL